MLHDPATGLNTVAAKLDVYQHDEEGVQSIAIDPNFKSEQVGLHLPLAPDREHAGGRPGDADVNEGDAPFNGTAGGLREVQGGRAPVALQDAGDKIDLNTEQQIIDVPVDRGICCHVGGHIDFDSQGNLYLSTGDDTNPFESRRLLADRRSPGSQPGVRRAALGRQHERPARQGAADQAEGRRRLRDPGGEPVPAGRAQDQAGDLPDGPAQPVPDRGQPRRTTTCTSATTRRTPTRPNPQRGPAGKGKWFVARGPGNYGWPYCATDELPYQDWDFATKTSGGAFNCAAPVNDSPYNTGLRELPPIRHPDVWYSTARRAEFPELGTGGIGPMGGPAYNYKPNSSSRIKWPQYYDGVPLFYEWTRDYIKEMRLDESGKLLKINPVLPSFTFDNPMDIEFGEDGALYTLEYGTGYFVTTAGGAARARRLRAREPDADREGRRPTPKDSPTRAADGEVLERGDERPRR